MDWPEIAGLCQKELEGLRAGLPAAAAFFPSGDQVASTFLVHERQTNSAVERAIGQFAADRTWPPMSEIERTMLCFRLEFSAALAGLLAEQPAPWTDSPESQNDEDRLEWLMLFAWEQEGFSLLHESLDRLVETKSES